MRHRADSLPWLRLLETAYGVLHLTPQAFWAMTPGEWMAGLKGWKDSHGLSDTGMAITRQELEKMIIRFPDNQGTAY